MAKKKSRRPKTKAASTASADDHFAEGTLQKERIQLHERDRNVVALDTVVAKSQGAERSIENGDEKVQLDSIMACEPDTVEATRSPEPKSEPIDNKDAKLLAEQHNPDPEDVVVEYDSNNTGNNTDPAAHVYTSELDTADASDARTPEPKSEPVDNKNLKLLEQHNPDPEDIVVGYDSDDSGNKMDPAAHVETCELDTAGASDVQSPEPKSEPIDNKDLKLVEQHNPDLEDIVLEHDSSNKPDSPTFVYTSELDTAGASDARSLEPKSEPVDNKNLKLLDQHNPDPEDIVVGHDSNNTGNSPDPATHVYNGIKGVWAWGKQHVVLVSSILNITEGIANKVVGIVLHSNLKEMDENVVRPIFSGLDEKVLNPVIHSLVSTGLGAGDFIAKTVLSPLVSLPAVVGLVKTNENEAME